MNLVSNVSRYPGTSNVGHYGIYNDTSGTETQMIWNDGTPVGSSTNERTKLWQNSATLGQGWTFSVPADTTTRTLNVLAGSYSAGMTISAQLSDNSFADYSYTDPGGSATVRKVYTFTYAAASAGQSLLITLTKTANNNGRTDGSVDLLGAWLSVSRPRRTRGAGTPVLGAASDSGVSNSDNITNVTTPTFTGTRRPTAPSRSSPTACRSAQRDCERRRDVQHHDIRDVRRHAQHDRPATANGSTQPRVEPR